MSQLGSKAPAESPGPTRVSVEPGTFDDVAGFRNGRGGRDGRAPQARPQQPPYGQQAPPAPQGQPYGYPAAPQPHPQQRPQQRPQYGSPAGGGRQWSQGNGGNGAYGDEPEYFGDGAWQPTVGLSMLIMSLTDAPRLVFAMFFGGDATFVQALGWATWVAAGALLTMMVGRSHDLPWPKALGASAIQLIALLSIVKLGTF